MTLPPFLGASSHPDESRARYVLLILGVAILFAVAPYMPGLLGGVILFAVTAPMHAWLTRRMRPRQAATIVVIAVLLVILLPGGWIATTAVLEAADAIRRFQTSDWPERLKHVQVGGIDVSKQISDAGGTVVSWMSGRLFSFFGSATRATLNLVIALFGCFYLLLSGPMLWYRARPYLPMADNLAEQLRIRFVAVTEAMVIGTLLTAIIQGAMIGIGFAIVGLHGAVLWGVVTAIASILPVLGSALVWVPGTVLLFLGQRPGAALVLLAIGVVASNVDNVIRLVVYRRVSDVHPMITLVGAFAGVGVFGLVGVLVGPLVLLYFVELLRAYDAAFGVREAGLRASRSQGIRIPPEALADIR
jgi:predicted PurR-regulated permease PerM